MPMKVAIIGAGSLGRALGTQLARCGHAIMFGGTASAQEAATEQGATAGSNAEAAAFGDVVVLAVPFADVSGALSEAGSLDGRVLWCCVNALKRDLSGLAVGFDTSAAEEVARRVPRARVVGALPPFAQAVAAGDLTYAGGLSPTVFVCGDDAEAKRIIERLLQQVGAHAVDAGPLSASRLIEPAMMLLVSLAYAGIPRDLGLRLLERRGAH